MERKQDKEKADAAATAMRTTTKYKNKHKYLTETSQVTVEEDRDTQSGVAEGAETEKKITREDRARVHTFLNLSSTSVFTKKTDVNQLMLTYHYLTSIFERSMLT